MKYDVYSLYGNIDFLNETLCKHLFMIRQDGSRYFISMVKGDRKEKLVDGSHDQCLSYLHGIMRGIVIQHEYEKE